LEEGIGLRPRLRSHFIEDEELRRGYFGREIRKTEKAQNKHFNLTYLGVTVLACGNNRATQNAS
jgi:hypothetical protein